MKRKIILLISITMKYVCFPHTDSNLILMDDYLPHKQIFLPWGLGFFIFSTLFLYHDLNCDSNKLFSFAGWNGIFVTVLSALATKR